MISPVFGNRRLTPSGKSPPAHEQNRLPVGAPSLPSPIGGIARYSVELKRRFAIVGAVALIIVSALVFWLNRGPRYEGKPPGYWVEQLLHDNAKARQALQKIRSEEHTSELQSRGHLVCRLLLEKKKRK